MNALGHAHPLTRGLPSSFKIMQWHHAEVTKLPAGAEVLDLPREAVAGMRSASEPYAMLLARTVRERFGATWGVSETGAAGPNGNGYGDASGHSCIAISGPVEFVMTLETGSDDRVANMEAFAAGVLDLLARVTAED